MIITKNIIVTYYLLFLVNKKKELAVIGILCDKIEIHN